MTKTITTALRCALGSVVIFVALASLATAADRKVRCIQADKPIPQLEDQKSILASGQYRSFFAFADHQVNTQAKQGHDSPEDILKREFPKGFADCTTFYSQHFSKHFVREAFVLRTQDSRILLMTWDALKLDRRWSIISYYISSDYEEIRQYLY
jgi:hypothetical protein